MAFFQYTMRNCVKLKEIQTYLNIQLILYTQNILKTFRGDRERVWLGFFNIVYSV